jgi:uncharacterized protein (DUF1778 family)
MADGSISLELDARTAALLTRAAEAADQSPAQFAARLISEALELAADRARGQVSDQRLVDFDRTGACLPLDEVLSEFEANVEAGLSRKA